MLIHIQTVCFISRMKNVLPVIPESGMKREEAIRLTGGYQRTGERGENKWDGIIKVRGVIISR